MFTLAYENNVTKTEVAHGVSSTASEELSDKIDEFKGKIGL